MLNLSAMQVSLEDDDFWVWCGSVIEGDNGNFHMFASCWPKSLPFTSWATHSEVWRAESSKPMGPYKLKEKVLGRRGENFWDGSSIHNPNIHKVNDRYYLFYSGAVFKGPYPDSSEPEKGHSKQWLEAWNSSRIGLAWADKLEGPWNHGERPILEPRKDQWDSIITTNPAAAIKEDGSVLLIYKSISKPYVGETLPDRFKVGVCQADTVVGNYLRIQDEEINFASGDTDLEDPYLWFADKHFHMLAKDMDGSICGTARSGVYAKSIDGINWNVPSKKPAYTLKQNFKGQELSFPFLERVHRLKCKNDDEYLFYATGEMPSNGHYADLRKTYNVVCKVL